MTAQQGEVFPFSLPTLTLHVQFIYRELRLQTLQPLSLDILKEKTSSLHRSNTSSPAHCPPTYHCGFFHFLRSFASPTASLSLCIL